jgi:hypothetical protein
MLLHWSVLTLLACAQVPEPIVFRGTIQLRHSATIATDDVSRLAVVRVQQFFSGPPAIRAFVGKDITVQLLDPEAARDKEERVFTVRPWLFGESVAVVELSSRPVAPLAGGRETLAGAMRQEQTAAVDSVLSAKLDRAQAVVTGRVVAIRPAGQRMLSEHDPEWSEADIVVSEVLKGEAQAGNRLTILFPASKDVMWYRVPKPTVEQSGVWLLTGDLPGAKSRELLGIANRGDFLAGAQLARVRRLLRR